jgi:hypothetical protein
MFFICSIEAKAQGTWLDGTSSDKVADYGRFGWAE